MYYGLIPQGIMSFSQGACLTSMLCAMMRTETVLSDLSFVMLFNGFRSRISKHDKYYTDTIDSVRSLHVYGQSDEVIPLGKLTLDVELSSWKNIL